MPNVIEQNLNARGARLRASGAVTEHRANNARLIARHFETFDRFRPRIAGSRAAGGIVPGDAEEQDLLDRLTAAGFVKKIGRSRYAPASGAVPFLTGEWLEDLAYAAALDAGADAAVVRAKLAWRVGPYHGMNELDVIARRDDRLFFISCKCARAAIEVAPGEIDEAVRVRLMQYLHEADNLADHFGKAGDAVVLMVTTDLIDEAGRNRARYGALFGKAEALQVELIGLDHLYWPILLNRMKSVIGEPA
jgi:hypothetical protein